MKKLLKSLLAASALALTMTLMAAPAFAETLTSPTAWNVTFTSDAKMETNFQANDISQMMNDVQPGDTAEIVINLKNDYKDSTNWYMTNRILNSLEDTVESAKGGAYTYELSYVSPSNETTTLFSSDTVGGDTAAGGKQGLKEVTGAMDDYFLLGTLNKGQSAKVELAVSLDGETQGNAYQQSLADLSMDFAVEIGPTGAQRNITSTASLLQTGDQFMNNLPIYLGLAGLGIIVLIIAIVGRRKSKKDEEGVHQA